MPEFATAAFRSFALAAALLSLPAAGQTHASPAHHAASTAKAGPAPTGPVVLIDTTLGRISCRLFSKEAPLTTANFLGLADGSKDWTDASTGQVVHGKPFYDATAIGGVVTGITAGDRLGARKGVAGPPLPLEKSGVAFDRAGRLAMALAPAAVLGDKDAPRLNSSSLFFILDHANLEYDGRAGTVFGQCDDASLPTVTALSHALLTVNNHPAAPLAINKISVVQPGEPRPPIAPDVPASTVSPQPAPMPVDPIAAPEPTGPTALIETTRGLMTCRLFEKETPIGTANFIGLVNGTKDWRLPTTKALQHNKRFYDGLHFRRVLPDFMVQNSDLPGDLGGDGDIGFHFDVETVPGLTFDRPGRLAYANGGPNTNESEFFVTEHPVHSLDGHYTIFGQCDDASVKVVETIARVPRDEHNRPLTPVVIRRITIVPAK